MAIAAPLALGAGILGGITGAIGQVQQSDAQASMYKYQAGLSAQNALIQKQNETYALQQGEQAANQSGMKSRFQEGQIKVGQAASGFNVNTGTDVNVQQGQKLIGQMDQAAIRSTAAKRAYDYDISSIQASDQASAYTASAKNVQAAMPLSIASSILGSAASVGSKWNAMQTSGAIGSSNFFGL